MELTSYAVRCILFAAIYIQFGIHTSYIPAIFRYNSKNTNTMNHDAIAIAFGSRFSLKPTKKSEKPKTRSKKRKSKRPRSVSKERKRTKKSKEYENKNDKDWRWPEKRPDFLAQSCDSPKKKIKVEIYLAVFILTVWYSPNTYDIFNIL